MGARSRSTIGFALGAMTLLGFISVGEASAIRIGGDAEAAPVLVEAGFDPPRFDEGRWRPGALWLRLAEGPAAPYLIERVGGDDPLALASIWHRPQTVDVEGGQLRFPLDGDVAVPPFGVAVRVRALAYRTDADRGGPPSNALWVANPHPRSAARSGDAGRALFVGFALGLGLIAFGFRRAREPETRVRLAAVAALAGAVILLTTSGMPWLGSVAIGSDCLLGDEAICAAPPLGELDARQGVLALFELERWEASASAVRMGQLLAFALLLPALIWLLVEPRARPAQATCAVGASVAGFALLAIAFYRTTMPSWMVADPYVTFDLALLASGAIVAAAIAIVRQAFALVIPPGPPRAIVRS
jgi:hypothetical protein